MPADEDFPQGEMRDAAMGSVLVAWASSDGPAAARWASHLPSTESGPSEPLAVFGMGGSVTLMDAHYDRGQAMQLATFEWAKRDRQAALAWVESVADPALRAVLVRQITKKE